MTTKKNKINIIKGASRPFEAEGYLEVGVTVPRDERKRRANNESDMECGDLSALSF